VASSGDDHVLPPAWPGAIGDGCGHEGSEVRSVVSAGLTGRPALSLGELGAVGGHSGSATDDKADMTRLAPLVCKIPVSSFGW
jgi:hypothetical protein